MDNVTRMSASAIIICENKILLVKYATKSGGHFLLGPGGGVFQEEDLHTGLRREVREETGLDVHPGHMLFVEDILGPRYRILKIWFFCEVLGGNLSALRPEAQAEGIVGVDWYDRASLENQIVFPSIVTSHDWGELANKNWVVRYSGLTRAQW